MDRLKQISNFFGMFTIQKANLLHHVIQQEFTYHSFFYVLSYKMNDIHYIVKWFRATICVYEYKCRYIYKYIYKEKAFDRVYIHNSEIQAFLQPTLFFNSVSVLLNSFLNWASNVPEVLLNTCNHHYTDI